MRKIGRLPRWRGRQQQGRHELDPAAAAAAHMAWTAELADQGSMGLADELAARRQVRAGLAIEDSYLTTGELWPRNSDTGLPPGWHFAAAAELGYEGGEAAAAALDEDQAQRAAARGEDQAAELALRRGLELAVATGAEFIEAPGLGAGNAQAILMAARMLDQAGTVDAALELAANTLRVLGTISEAVGPELDEDQRALRDMLGRHYGPELGDPAGDA